jgi:hypothetical protein
MLALGDVKFSLSFLALGYQTQIVHDRVIIEVNYNALLPRNQ